MLPMTFTRDHADTLRAALPVLHFGVDLQEEGAENPLVDAYVEFYRLDFSPQFPGVIHRLGKLGAAGFDIATQYWIPAKACGTLIVVHGYYDHVGIFRNVVEYGLQRGLAVLAFDLPGHGLSSGARAAIDSFDQYGDVLAQVLHTGSGLLPQPFYAIGQSTGGAVLLNHLWRYQSEPDTPKIERIALCAPLVLPRAWNRGKIAYAMLHRFIQTLPRGRSRNSGDTEFVRFVDEVDPLQSHRLSVRWVGAMKAWDEQFKQFPPLLHPVLLVQGDEDQTVDWRYNLQQIQQRLPQLHVAMVSGARHQLVNEQQDLRIQVFAHIDHFFFSH